jgi:hypothetical protein
MDQLAESKRGEEHPLADEERRELYITLSDGYPFIHASQTWLFMY